jgi:hypothetical protein
MRAHLQAPSHCLTKITQWATVREAKRETKTLTLSVANPTHPVGLAEEIPRLGYVPTEALREIGQHADDQVHIVHVGLALLGEREIGMAQVDRSGDALWKDEKCFVERLHGAIGISKCGVVQPQL